jgi:hypothetical protein
MLRGVWWFRPPHPALAGNASNPTDVLLRAPDTRGALPAFSWKRSKRQIRCLMAFFANSRPCGNPCRSPLYEPSAGFEDNVPYAVALVKLEEGPLVTTQLTDVDPQEVSIGIPVKIVARRLHQDGDEHGLLVYGYKFRNRLAGA